MNAQDFVSRIEWLEKNVLGDSDPSKFINAVLLALDDYRAAQPGVERTSSVAPSIYFSQIHVGDETIG